MKNIPAIVLILASTAIVSASVIPVPNGDFGSAGNNGSIQGNLLSGGQTATPLGSGPWSAQTVSLAGLLAPPQAVIGGGTATISGLLGLGVAGQSNSAQFFQTISGVSYLPNNTYTLTVTIDSGVPLSLSLLGTNGIGIALTRGGNSNVLANSLSASPELVNFTPLSGTAYQLSLQYSTSFTPLVGDVGVRLFAGTNASLATASLLGDVTFDTVTLTAVPEPSSVGFALAGLAGIAILLRRRRLRALAVAGAMLAVGIGESRAVLAPVQTLNVTLLPDTTYEITVDVSTNAIGTLLALLDGGTDVLQIVDGDDNTIGSLPVQDLIDALTGLTGEVTQQLTMIVETAGTQVINPVLKVLDSPALQVTNVTVTPAARTDRAPAVTITSRKRSDLKLKLRGTATDDGQVQSVTITTNGRQRKAKGTSTWSRQIKLRPGRNRIVVRAFDNTQRVSSPRRLVVTVE